MKAPFSKILVAVDGSRNSINAAKQAMAFAKNGGVVVVILNVIDLPSIFKILPTETKRHLIRLGRDEAQKILDVVKRLAKQANVDVKTEVIEGSTFAGNAINDYAKKNRVDLVVIGAGEKHAVSKALLGSVASKVIANAPCPVLVFR